MASYSKRFNLMISVMMAVLIVGLYFIMPSEARAEEQTEAVLGDGVTVVSESVSDKIYNITEGKALAIKGSNNTSPVIIENCTFNIAGSTMKINGSGVGYNGETITKLGIGGNIIFKNVIINVNEGNTVSSSGNDAAITMFDGNIDFEDSIIDVKNWAGQGIGLYGKANVEFKNSALKNTDNRGGWCYAMYGSSVMSLDNTDMSATGMSKVSGNINAFYSGDSLANYDALYIKNGSTVDFHNNQAGGFAINNVKIYVENSEVNVSNNAGNASNSGKWFVENSKITIAGNKGHGWSHHSDTVTNSEINIIHNGYAGYYINKTSGDSTWENSKINVRCNGERLKSYSGKDITLNGRTLTLKDCGIAWIGAVGNSGQVKTEGNTKVIAYDIDESGLKNNSSPVLKNANMASADRDKDGHVLFLNPEMEADYARGFNDNSDDADLTENTSFEGNNIKIGKLTEAQLSHHEYDWENGEVVKHATEESYGVKKIKCNVCNEYISNSKKYKNGSDCKGTFVYAPLVAIEFDMNVGNETDNHIEELTYGEDVSAPEKPTREGYEFKGWFTDEEFNERFDFNKKLTDCYTIVYAKWEVAESVIDNSDRPVTPAPNPTNSGTNGGIGGGTIGNGGIDDGNVDDNLGTGITVGDNATTIKRITDTKPPLASTDHWALLNLLLTIFTVIMSVILIGLYFKSKRDDEEAYAAQMENREDTRSIKKRGIPRILSAIWAVFMVIVFFITEDMTLPMRFTDEWTWLMVIMAIMQLCIAVLCKKVYDSEREEPDAIV